uniref:hypothetical protein n=1 Tax=Methylobacterium nigriterrae TaxID=3127512 RepID=UPI003D66A0C2
LWPVVPSPGLQHGTRRRRTTFWRHMADADAASHMLRMVVFTPSPYTLQIEPSRTEPGRFDWVVLKEGVVVRRSARSFGSAGTAAANGDTVLREITALWCTGKQQ